MSDVMLVRRRRFISPTHGFGLVPVVGFTTFDNTFLDATASLSNGNLTVSDTTSSNNTASRSTTYYTSGKFYAEFTAVSIQNGAGIGFCNGSVAPTQTVSQTANGIEYFSSSGIIFFNSAGVGNIPPGWLNNDILSMALDLNNSKVWFRQNGGPWDGTTDDPASNVGGFSLSGLGVNAGPYYAFAECRGAGAGNAASITANFGALGFTYVPPSGFVHW